MEHGRQNGNGRVDDADDDDVDDDEDDDVDDDERVALDPLAAAEAERFATEAVGGTLIGALADLAATDDAIAVRSSGAATEYAVRGLAFARADGPSASFRLRPEIAAAALRTDGTAASPLGRGWVVFSPRRWDRYALDRAIAWFLLARRLAGERP